MPSLPERLLFCAKRERERTKKRPLPQNRIPAARMPTFLCDALAGLSGFIALGLRLPWYRVFRRRLSRSCHRIRDVVGHLHGWFALGSFLNGESWVNRKGRSVNLLLGVLAVVRRSNFRYLRTRSDVLSKRFPTLLARRFSFCFRFVGSVLPVVCQLAILRTRGGRKVTWYMFRTSGSALRSLGVGFVLTQYFGLKGISLGLGLLAVFSNSCVGFS